MEDVGAQMVKEVASKTSDVAGDGTTTATVLAQALVTEGLKNVTAGANPMSIKRGIDAAAGAVVESLKSQSKDLPDSKQIANVATISSNDDREIGDKIAEAMEKVGKDGVITVNPLLLLSDNVPTTSPMTVSYTHLTLPTKRIV